MTVLFEIDPRPYQAQLDQAQGQVILNEARLKEAQADNAASQSPFAKLPVPSASKTSIAIRPRRKRPTRRCRHRKASLEVYKLNLSFCQVTSPIDGQVSRYFLHARQSREPRPDTTNDRRVARSNVRLFQHGRSDVGCAFAEPLPKAKSSRIRAGNFRFISVCKTRPDFRIRERSISSTTRSNSTTGSITVRGVVQNPQPEVGHRLLSPGMFVRVHLPIGQPHPALLVIDRAIGSDQGLKYVYTMDERHKIQQKTMHDRAAGG